ncbi:hypothetical protein [Nonomuraea guangzhouensis]|uniref:SH3 domain-containing protein n=1 Tax=Nonomuraea guangzhouensis TaxID=1291555 RepID=A0ABW4G985_9ACTN|nr:hypothetical protein [Nonomuraea guangzhouensis]
MRSVGKIATLTVAAALTSGVLVSSAHATSATEGATQASALLWPCVVQAKWAVKVHKRKSLSSGYRVAKKGTKFHGYCWDNKPTWKWTEVWKLNGGGHGYVWHTGLKMVR